jgi:hypothetical protein
MMAVTTTRKAIKTKNNEIYKTLNTIGCSAEQI